MGRGNQLTLSWKGASLLKQHCLQTVSAEGLKCCQGARWKRERSIDITPSLFSCWCLHSSASVFQRVVDQSESETCKQRTDRSSVLTVPSEVSAGAFPLSRRIVPATFHWHGSLSIPRHFSPEEHEVRRWYPRGNVHLRRVVK